MTSFCGVTVLSWLALLATVLNYFVLVTYVGDTFIAALFWGTVFKLLCFVNSGFFVFWVLPVVVRCITSLVFEDWTPSFVGFIVFLDWANQFCTCGWFLNVPLLVLVGGFFIVPDKLDYFTVVFAGILAIIDFLGFYRTALLTRLFE